MFILGLRVHVMCWEKYVGRYIAWTNIISFVTGNDNKDLLLISLKINLEEIKKIDLFF